MGFRGQGVTRADREEITGPGVKSWGHGGGDGEEEGADTRNKRSVIRWGVKSQEVLDCLSTLEGQELVRILVRVKLWTQLRKNCIELGRAPL